LTFLGTQRFGHTDDTHRGHTNQQSSHDALRRAGSRMTRSGAEEVPRMRRRERGHHRLVDVFDRLAVAFMEARLRIRLSPHLYDRGAGSRRHGRTRPPGRLARLST
jgi:hypothetical protein